MSEPAHENISNLIPNFSLQFFSLYKKKFLYKFQNFFGFGMSPFCFKDSVHSNWFRLHNFVQT